MSLFSSQPLFCSNCGQGISKAGFDHHHWITCSMECWRELNWKYTLSVMGKPYRPRSFMQRVRDGDKANVDDYVEEWHEGDSTLSLREFLGMTEEEYKKFVENAEVV